MPNQLIKMAWQRDYLLNEPERLSLQDLADLQSGTLLPFVKKLALAYRDHILKRCTLCKNRGSLCLVCKSDQIIYPFMFQSTTRFPVCATLVHKSCWDPQKCPRCTRVAKK